MLIENILGDNIGYVQLVDSLGTDKSIVDAARVSYNGESKGDEQDNKLLRYLWTNKHTSPFEMCSFKIIIKCPLFIRSQIQRHRTFSYNEVSRRYTSEDIEFYFPKEWRLQDTKNKQGSLVDRFDNTSNNYWNEEMRMRIQNSVDLYNEMIDDNVAREQARMVLPQNLYTKIRDVW
ncbi:MAG: FAD-dependent thymidylate synthase [Richelia sp. SL_2_1]|nr:FAD-dependent thymidylate synthase [Richelia sp. SL_2_1]